MGPHQHARRIRFFRGKIARRTWNPPPEISRMKLRQIREAQKRKNKNNISQMRERLCRLTYLYADGPYVAGYGGGSARGRRRSRWSAIATTITRFRSPALITRFQVRGYVHEVVIGCGAEVIARHQRSYEKADMVFDPMHFLPLLEQKVGALDQAAPLQGWDPARGVCHPAPAAGSAHGKEGQARIRPGSAAP